MTIDPFVFPVFPFGLHEDIDQLIVRKVVMLPAVQH
jgi:hypothetical protein